MSPRDKHVLLQPRRRGQVWLWVVALSAILASLYMGHTAWRTGIATRDAEASLQRVTAQLQRRVVPAPVLSRAEIEQSRRWSALAAERAYSWYPLFQALEKSSSDDVELLEFMPDKAAHSVVLRGEARTVEDLNAYLAALAAQHALRNVHLVHQKNASRGGLLLVQFEIRALIREMPQSGR